MLSIKLSGLKLPVRGICDFAADICGEFVLNNCMTCAFEIGPSMRMLFQMLPSAVSTSRRFES